MAYVPSNVLLRRQMRADRRDAREQDQWDRMADTAMKIEDIRDRQAARQRDAAKSQAELAAQLDEARPTYNIAPVEESAEIGYMKGRLAKKLAADKAASALDISKEKNAAQAALEEAQYNRYKYGWDTRYKIAQLGKGRGTGSKAGAAGAKWKMIDSVLEDEQSQLARRVDQAQGFADPEDIARLDEIGRLRREASFMAQLGSEPDDQWLREYIPQMYGRKHPGFQPQGEPEPPPSMQPETGPEDWGPERLLSMKTAAGERARQFESKRQQERAAREMQQREVAKNEALMELGQASDRVAYERLSAGSSAATLAGSPRSPLAGFSRTMGARSRANETKKKAIAYALFGEPAFETQARTELARMQLDPDEEERLTIEVQQHPFDYVDLPGVDASKVQSETGYSANPSDEDVARRLLMEKTGG